MTPPAEPRFAFQLLDPSPVAFLRNVAVTTVGLVVIVVVHGLTEGQGLSMGRVLILVPWMSGVSVVLWGVATAVFVLTLRPDDE